MFKKLPYFNAKIKVVELNKTKRWEATFDQIVKQLPPNNDTYYIDHDRTTDTFKLKKDNKIKINDDSGEDIKFLKQTLSHPRDRLARQSKKKEDLNVLQTKGKKN